MTQYKPPIIYIFKRLKSPRFGERSSTRKAVIDQCPFFFLLKKDKNRKRRQAFKISLQLDMNTKRSRLGSLKSSQRAPKTKWGSAFLTRRHRVTHTGTQIKTDACTLTHTRAVTSWVSTVASPASDIIMRFVFSLWLHQLFLFWWIQRYFFYSFCFFNSTRKI